ncbi:CAAX prenyl protease 2 isoform X2 [Neoarius graeffei]|uniref:CAAX prenyl protease 2 isoform X2 n=1 Tax=Neoarius graeffei TaxID=443677 RepID=UPI00298D5563|nr:CAAX prenyl protease 2 isoform X2 [Neoarius graeffei]
MPEDDDLMPGLSSQQIRSRGDEFVPPDGLCWISVLSCLLLACSYVGSLYVWKSDLPRDNPSVIKRRFTSVLIVSALSPLFVWGWKEFTGIQPTPSLLALMGIRFEGLIPAVILPLILTMVLFLGPLIQLAMDCPWGFIDGIKVAVDPRFWALCLSDMRWLRNQVVAPLTEELVFRACMLPMLVPCAGPSTSIFTCPLFFGVAHFHHVIELLRFRQGTISGIFLSAGHLVGPVLCHSFCNYMGFPALSSALEHPHRLTVLFFYVLGVLLFLLCLFPMTDPIFYGWPTPVCTLASSLGSLCS